MQTFAREWFDTIGSGRTLIDTGANLSTSRLVTFGFLSEAQERGLETYDITGEVNGRTCPICWRMYGRSFEVDRPLARLEQQLTTGDPNKLKASQPFPSSSKAGLLELEELSASDLQERGWDTPPFHQLCRNVLQRTRIMRTEVMTNVQYFVVVHPFIGQRPIGECTFYP